MEQIRTFIAIELPVSIKSALSIIQDKLKLGSVNCVRWVDPDNIHLTLKFLGNVSAGRILLITESMNEAIIGIAPFQISLEKAGAFPNMRVPRVVWVGLSGDINALLSVQGRIEEALAKLNFTPENRPFSPHLTLGRVKEGASFEEKRGLGEKIASLKIDSIESFTADAVSLMQSTLTRQGAVYNCLSKALLKNK
jgi:2'-5' RNA ligase